ncbi:MAG: preprotein translocase subunit YajC [Geothrix sp.]|uniref:preprotein translocase subunit YajC n=1 Tax=Geothrix sp. TaxID=1962974 RepID=UPI0018158435|nr:preprotein translocase subunit YajC [Geothrix sp.]NWJ42326.1 preprotein translocase subunit YajC [Geothrix sp.]WIL19706.1 MAG: preprotein translocase subunit YajC [Geothrix sp.]
MTFALLDTPPGPQGLEALLKGPFPMMLGMGLLFYFFILRPQSKARKEMEARLAKLKAGDEVVLSSGLYATIDRVEDKDLYVKLGNTVVKARRSAVATLASETEPKQN